MNKEMSIEDLPRFAVNRSIARLVYKQPFADWLKINSQNSETCTLKELGEDRNTFLIPRFNDIGGAIEWVENHWRTLFECILFDWMPDDTEGESSLPQNRTLKMFREWFDIKIHTMTWDLDDAPLITEDWDADPISDEVLDEGSNGLLH